MSLLEREVESDVLDDDPGATIMWFGKYQGKRLDELELGYRHKLLEYAAETPAPNLVRFRDLHQKYTAWLDEQREPGATTMWFGIYKGTRLDHLEERYRRELVHLSYEHPSATLVDFRELHEKYLSWLDERRSPLSTIIWFGKFKGHEVRVIYEATRRWNWLIDNCEKWRPDLMDIQRRYKVWKSKQPPKQRGAPRAQREVVNPVGEKLGLSDDGVASDADEDYDSDDGFIVPDDDESTDAEDPGYDTEDLLKSEDEDNGTRLDDLFKDLEEDNAAADLEDRHSASGLSPRQSRDNANARDKDDDLTSLGADKKGRECRDLSEDTESSISSQHDLFRPPAAPKPGPGKHRLLTRSRAKKRQQASTTNSSDTELEAPPAKRNTTSISPHKRRRSYMVISSSDSASDSDTPLISPSKKRRQVHRKPSSIDDGGSSDDKPLTSPHKNRRQK